MFFLFYTFFFCYIVLSSFFLFFFDLPSFSFFTYVGVCMGCPSYIPNSTVSYLSYLLPSQLSEKRKKMSFSHSFSMVPCYIVFLASKFFQFIKHHRRNQFTFCIRWLGIGYIRQDDALLYLIFSNLFMGVS